MKILLVYTHHTDKKWTTYIANGAYAPDDVLKAVADFREGGVLRQRTVGSFSTVREACGVFVVEELLHLPVTHSLL